jgi:hypothetical protein
MTTHWIVVALCAAVAVAIGRFAARRRESLKRAYADKYDVGDIAEIMARAKRNVGFVVGAFILGFFALSFIVAWFDSGTTRSITAPLSIVLVFVCLFLFFYWRTEQIVANARLKELSGGATNKRNSLEVEK